MYFPMIAHTVKEIDTPAVLALLCATACYGRLPLIRVGAFDFIVTHVVSD